MFQLLHKGISTVCKVLYHVGTSQLRGSPKSKTLVYEYLARLQEGLIFFGYGYGFRFSPYNLHEIEMTSYRGFEYPETSSTSTMT